MSEHNHFFVNISFSTFFVGWIKISTLFTLIFLCVQDLCQGREGSVIKNLFAGAKNNFLVARDWLLRTYLKIKITWQNVFAGLIDDEQQSLFPLPSAFAFAFDSDKRKLRRTSLRNCKPIEDRTNEDASRSLYRPWLGSTQNKKDNVWRCIRSKTLSVDRLWRNSNWSRPYRINWETETEREPIFLWTSLREFISTLTQSRGSCARLQPRSSWIWNYITVRRAACILGQDASCTGVTSLSPLSLRVWLWLTAVRHSLFPRLAKKGWRAAFIFIHTIIRFEAEKKMQGCQESIV